MAKVTITLEDAEAEGTTGLNVDITTDPEDTEETTATYWAEVLLSIILKHSKKTIYKEDAEGGGEDQSTH